METHRLVIGAEPRAALSARQLSRDPKCTRAGALQVVGGLAAPRSTAVGFLVAESAARGGPWPSLLGPPGPPVSEPEGELRRGAGGPGTG